MQTPTPKHRNVFQQRMLLASALSWVLVTLMPIINAHGASAGVWARLCTINGFEYVQVEQATASPQHSKPCPFAYFSSLPDFTTTSTLYIKHSLVAEQADYALLAQSTRFEPAIPRAPPIIRVIL